MKSTLRKLTAAAFAILAVGNSIPTAKAADLTLDGYGSYSLGTSVSYYNTPPKQYGRYSNLGRDYYHSATIRIDYVTNNSNSYSGDLSFELWAKRYYDGTSGIVLMTHSASGLSPYAANKVLSRSGKAVSIDRYRFPELNLFEYTRNGWKSRDYLTFSKKTYM